MNDKFSLEWFKAKKELLEKQLEGQTLENEVLRSLVSDITEPYIEKEKLYQTLKLVGDTMTVVFHDGSLLTKVEATPDDFRKVKQACHLNDIFNVIGSFKATKDRIKDHEKEMQHERSCKGLEILKEYDDFTIKDSSVYLKGINRTLPPLLVAKFVEIIERYPAAICEYEMESYLEEDDEYQGLKNFFMWSCLNPRAEVASDLYDFLERNSFRITKQGFFVALRNVVTLPVKGDNELIKFICNGYNKIKAVWKQDPNKYRVVKYGGEYNLVKTSNICYSGESIGNLKDLYLDLPNMQENRFTDEWTRTFDIRIGKVVDMPMKDCSWSRQDCASAGLHFTADEINYVGCGDTSILILINPMKVVGIGSSKGRCYEYLPIMTVPRLESTEILHDIDFDTLALDEDYAIRELEKIEDIAKAGWTDEIPKDRFNLPAMSHVEMKNIVNSLNKMKATLSKRISVIE